MAMIATLRIAGISMWFFPKWQCSFSVRKIILSIRRINIIYNKIMTEQFMYLYKQSNPKLWNNLSDIGWHWLLNASIFEFDLTIHTHRHNGNWEHHRIISSSVQFVSELLSHVSFAGFALIIPGKNQIRILW